MPFWSRWWQQLRGALRPRRFRTWRVDAAGERFVVDGVERCWRDLVQVSCWKRDLMTIDQCVLGLAFPIDGTSDLWEEWIEEDNPGFPAVLEVLQRRGCAGGDYWSRTPPFSPDSVVLWRRADAPHAP